MRKNYFSHRSEILPVLRTWRAQGFSITFTSGTFDLLHAGHVAYLQQAAVHHSLTKLIVGINDDLSVKKYKQPNRPINNEQDRLHVVAALGSVDAAFLFEETNNQANLLEIKPDFYLKSSDYNLETLTSASHLSKWGGKTVLVDFKAGYSTTKTIEKVLLSYCENQLNQLPQSEQIFLEQKPAIFLDRDGVINQEVEYLHEAELFNLLPSVIEGLKKMASLGYRLIIVTNQAGIGLGYFTKSDFFKVNQHMLRLFHQNKIVIDKIYYCPHSKADRCACRKPETLLIERAVKEVNLDLKNSYFIGDKTSDIKVGEKMGIKTILMETGHAGLDLEFKIKPTFKAKNLLQAAEMIESFKPI